MISNRLTHNLFAASAGTGEMGINTFQDLDTTFLVSESDIFGLEARRESNADELNGMDEASEIYDNGRKGSMSFTIDKAQPQHFAFLLAYGLGACVTTAAGSGKLHTITPRADAVDVNRDLLTFTGGYRYGRSVLKRRMASMAVDSVTATFARDAWVKISGQLKSTGKVEESVVEEVVTAAANATSLVLAANGVQGATDSDRLDSIHGITAETSAGVWEPVTVTAVSDASPAELTITAPGTATDSIKYKVLYAPTEAAWCTFPARVKETALRVSEMQVKMGGKYNGAVIEGGRDISSLLNSIECSLANAAEAAFGFGAGGAFASCIERGQRQQALKVNAEFRDLLIKQHMDSNDYFAVRILAEGAEFDIGHKYGVEYIYPRVGILKHDISASGKKLAQAGDLAVLQDDTYGSVIIKIKNLVSGYAA